MLGGTDKMLYENTAAFIETLVGPEPPNEAWIALILHKGLVKDINPKTIWAAKRLRELCSKYRPVV